VEDLIKQEPSKTLLTKARIQDELKNIDSITIEEQNERGILVWDEDEEKEIPFFFLEHMDASALAERIYVSKDIPQKYQVDKQALAKYLWNVCDRNAFVTLDEMVIIWSVPEDTEQFELQDFKDSGLVHLRERFEDDYALELGDELLGVMWYERNVVVINMGEIVRTGEWIERESIDIEDPYFLAENQIIIGLLTTVLHELRHLQMDTNIVLPLDEYPLELGNEAEVEEYCREVFESAAPEVEVLPWLFSEQDNNKDNPSLKEQIGAAEHIKTGSEKRSSQSSLFENLKATLFFEGIDAIQDFLDYDIDPYESKDIIDRRLDIAYEQMPNDILNQHYSKYNIGTKTSLSEQIEAASIHTADTQLSDKEPVKVSITER